MIVTIDLETDSRRNHEVTKSDIDKNIEAIQRAIDGNLTTVDTIYLLDTKSILAGIREQLPDKNRIYP